MLACGGGAAENGRNAHKAEERYGWRLTHDVDSSCVARKHKRRLAREVPDQVPLFESLKTRATCSLQEPARNWMHRTRQVPLPH